MGKKLLFANKVVPVHVLYIYAEVSDEHSKSVKHGFMSNFSNNYIYISHMQQCTVVYENSLKSTVREELFLALKGEFNNTFDLWLFTSNESS